MGFIKACMLSTLLLLNMVSWTRAAARPTPNASTTKLDSSTWGEMLVAQPTRIGSTIGHDNDYMSLQSLLTKNIPGTPEEKSRVVDLMLQLLAEIDLPTLCEVIANDTNRKTKNSSRDVKTFERSTTEAPEILFPSMKSKQRNVDAIPYFNILGRSSNAIPEKEMEQSPTVSRGLSHESITRYHRNMVDRVNKGMSAMREYGNKRRAAYFNGIRRKQNGLQAQFNANTPANMMSQVDEVNELKNLHAEERSTNSMQESWKRRSVEINEDENIQANSSDATVVPSEGSILNRALGSDEGLTSRNIWIQSMNVERPNSELYSQSLLKRADKNNNYLVRHKRIDQDDFKNDEVRALDDTLGYRSRSNLLKQLSWTEDKPSRDTELEYGIMGNKLFPRVSTTVKSGIIHGGSDIYNTNEINDEYVDRNLDKYNAFNSVNGEPTAYPDIPTEETIAENNFVNMDMSKTSEESNDINVQTQTPTNEINFTHNTFSNLQGESYVEENRNLTGSDRNTTFELGHRSDSSIDDFFGASSDAGRFVNLPENNNLHKSSPMSSSVTSEQVNATEKITYTGGNYLTDVLSGVSNANMAETQTTSSTETQADDSTNKPNFSGENMKTLTAGHKSVSTASSSDNFTGPVWIGSTTSHNKEGNVTQSKISNNTSYAPSKINNEDSRKFAETLNENAVENNFVMYDKQTDDKTEELYNDSSSSQKLKLDFQHKNKTAFSFIKELDNSAPSLSVSSKNNLNNLVKLDNNGTAQATNVSESIERTQQYNDTVGNTITSSFKNGDGYANSNISASTQNMALVKSAGLDARNMDASPVLEARMSTSTTPGNSTGINATAADTQEYHISRGAVTYNNHVEMNSTEPYVRYEPSSGKEQTEPSLHMFGPYGEGESKVKNDVVVADVVKATPPMSIEFDKADLEMELKKLSRDVSTLDKDFLSVMRGNQRGVQRGVSSTAYQSFLARPVMKSLKRIHEFRQQRGNSQNATDEVLSRASEVGKLVEATPQNSTYNESSTPLETLVSPAYNITHLGLEDLRQNVTIFTNKAKKDSYTNPVNDQVRNTDDAQAIVKNSFPYQANVTRYVSNKDQINETSTTTNSSWLNNFLTEKQINTIKSAINKLSSNNASINEYVSEMSNNLTLINAIGLNTSRDIERERRQPIESNNVTAQSQTLNITTRIPQQETKASEANHTNNFITDDYASMSSSNENTLYSNSASMNQTLVTFSSETLPFTNLSENTTDNSTSEMGDEQTDSYYMSGNTTSTEMPDVDGNTTDSDSVRNSTQTSGDFLRYFLTVSTDKAEDGDSKAPRSFYDSLENTVDKNDEETGEPLWMKSYGSDFSKYLNSKRPFKDVKTLQEYQNELMKNSDEEMIRQNILQYPNMKLSMKPESSPFLAQDFYKDSSKSSKSQQVARVNPWKAFNIELGKEKVKQQKEALHKFHYPSFKIRHHDDVIIPSVKDYLWNARPWPKSDKILSSHNGKYRSGFSKVNEYLREKQRDMDFSPLLSEHTKLWGNRFSQGYYGRVLEEQTRAPLMSSYLGFPGQLASLKTVDASARNFIGFKAVDQSTVLSPQRTDLQKDTAEKSLPTLVSTIPLKLITENIDNKVEPSFSLPKESNGPSLTRRSDADPTAVQNPMPGYNMIPPGPTGVPAADDFKCPGLFGYYTDPENCSSFFVCSWGISYRLQCSEGTLWNSADLVCDWAANVSCDQRKSP